MDCSSPNFSVRGILQSRILEPVALSSSRDLPNPGIEPTSAASPKLAIPLRHPGSLNLTHTNTLKIYFFNAKKKKRKLLNFNNKKTNLTRKWAKNCNRHLTPKEMQLAIGTWEKCSTSYVITGMKIKTALWSHYMPFRTGKKWDADNTKCCWGYRAEARSLPVGMQNGRATLAVSYKTNHALT